MGYYILPIFLCFDTFLRHRVFGNSHPILHKRTGTNQHVLYYKRKSLQQQHTECQFNRFLGLASSLNPNMYFVSIFVPNPDHLPSPEFLIKYTKLNRCGLEVIVNKTQDRMKEYNKGNGLWMIIWLACRLAFVTLLN